MQAYLGTTGTLFALIGLAHVLRLFVEGQPLSDRGFVVENLAPFLVCGGFAAWAGWLLMRSRGRPPEL